MHDGMHGASMNEHEAGAADRLAIEAFVARYKHRMRAVLAGHGPELDRVRARRAAVALERYATPSDATGLCTIRSALRRAARDHAAELMAPVLPEWLEHCGTRCTPVLRRPELLDGALRDGASRTCLSLLPPALRRRARRVMNRDESGVHHTDGRRVVHLAGIAHELGHCLQERRTGARSLAALITSESAAQILEHFVVARWLKATSGEAAEGRWNEYQVRAGALSLALCELDFADALGEQPPPAPFERAFCFVRTSYATAPGAECVFTAASVQRARVLHALGPHADVAEALLLSERTAPELIA